MAGIGVRGEFAGRTYGFWVSPKAFKTEGITNRVIPTHLADYEMKELFTTFLDYDGISFENLKEMITELQYNYNLGTAFIFKTQEDSFHVIFPTITSLQTQLNILAASECDSEFINYFMRFKERTLRTEGKGTQLAPEFVCVLLSHTHRAVSAAHLCFVIGKSKMKAVKPILETYNGSAVNTRLQAVQYYTTKYL